MQDDAITAELRRLRVQSQRIAGYAARQEIERILEPLRAEPKRLEPFGFKVYSQNDEDGILEEIFRRLGIKTGTFVEIGVESGLECNSLYLIHKGWRGTWIEGDRNRRIVIEQKFESILGARLKVVFSWVAAETVNPLLAAVQTPSDLDLLSIDIDGNDIYVLEALDLRPKVVCIEYNAKFPGHLDKRAHYDPQRRWVGSDYMGASLKAVELVGAAKGYRLVGTNITGSNAFLVREDLAGDLFSAPPTAEHLHNPPRYWLSVDHYGHVGHRADFGPYVDLMEPGPGS